MKADIDRLMEENGVDVLLVTGSGRHNPAMVYLTGGAFFNDATLIIKTGRTPVLFHYPMERDEAAKTGLDTIDLTDIGLDEIRRIGSGDPVRTDAEKYRRIFKQVGINAGHIAITGKSDTGSAFALFSELQANYPEITFDGKAAREILLKAMSTKDSDEIEFACKFAALHLVRSKVDGHHRCARHPGRDHHDDGLRTIAKGNSEPRPGSDITRPECPR